MMKYIFLTICLTLPAFSQEGSQFTLTNRQKTLEQIITAFRDSDLNRVQNAQGFLKNASRYSCSSDIAQLRIQCLMDVAKKQCEAFPKVDQPNCLLYSDVIVNNIVETEIFIPRKD